MQLTDPPNTAELASALTTPPPVLTPLQAQAIAASTFGIDGVALLLTSERDLNFHLRADDGAQYVLKITNAAEDPQVTDFQNAALLHVARTDPALQVPRVFRALDGGTLPRVAMPDGQMLVTRLLSFLPGLPQHRSAPGVAQRADLGRCLARLDLALREFSHPASGHELLWDIQHAARLRDRVVEIGDADRRGAALRFLDQFEAHVAPHFATLRRQVIHNDFNPHNIIVAAEAPERISGILDFGDMVDAPLVIDLAVAASYQMAADSPDPLAPALDLIAAYHRELALQPLEAALLTDLIAMRHVLTIAITEWRAARYPDNRAYILRNHPRACAGLAQLAAIPRAERQRRVREVCGMRD